ncbi:hypothetical protein [Micromonospora sp. NPDC092111]|uniref:hypothetical protein n=1 Tax=Micromonospora sp. NPDC092111 TaxID=3364289 RepID=UPI0037F24FAC
MDTLLLARLQFATTRTGPSPAWTPVVMLTSPVGFSLLLGAVGRLGWLALPLLPALLGFQAMCWWVFRGRTDGRAPVYW